MAAIKFPPVLTKAQRAKNKSVLAKIPAQNLEKQLAAIEEDCGPLSIKAVDVIGKQFDPVAYTSRRANYARLVKSKGDSLVKRLEAVHKELETARKGYTSKTDKKVSAYTNELEHAVRGLLVLAKRFPAVALDELDDAFKAGLRASPPYQFVQQQVQEMAPARQALMRAIVQVDGSKDLDEVKDVLAGSNVAPARVYSTKLGTWIQMITKFFPETAKSIYPGDAQADFLRGTWIEIAANKDLKVELQKKATTFRAPLQEQYEKAIAAMAKEYFDQVKHAEKLEDAIEECWKVLQKAAS